ncbi:Di-/tripeptide transporter [Bdellovibrio bacteriovorus]|uniref:peptide MFS transporter n=1 Tax=Bdellovibrio bacteriovorus TaxID=959 RepID=UPI00045C0337|nr:peptide MFS transporter [Bdellovibrio bacteriovorus]AHZ84351.1 peptide ABC transporter [Bdellovibrio bacteriovorus]BEV68239.1 Di-/tripeptide transporter [Bdellovibrio bacteriovorus]
MAATSTFMGHPRGLFTLFFTEMWERFSYYGMRVLLVLYMTQYLFLEAQHGKEIWGFSALKSFLGYFYGEMSVQAMSSQIYGLYTGLVYFTPFFGGIIADRFLGQRRSVYIGGFLMAIGHFLMAAESLFFPALLFLIVGNGFFKPNISTQVGGLYAQGDNRRDGAYTIFYMGINLGAIMSPLICGTLGQKVGWHWGFGAAGVGMLLSMAIYHFGGKHLPETEHKKSIKEVEATAHKPMTKEEWTRTIALTFLCMVTIFFWGVYEQQGNTMQLWADQQTDWNFFGWEIPSTWYQSFNPLVIILFAPLLDRLWAWQAKFGKAPSTVTKMALGCVLGAVALVVMYFAAKIVGGGQGSVMWLLGSTFLLTMAELYISPIGLSVVTKVSPAKIVSMMMGVWFLAAFFGNYVAGYVGMFYETMGKDQFWLLLAGLSLIPGIMFFACHKFLTQALGKEI